MKYNIHQALERVQGAIAALGSADLAQDMANIKAELDAPPSYDDAWDVINQDYWDDVRSVDAEIRRMAKDGEIEEDGLYDAIHEACDGSARVTYTHQARIGLCFTNNPDAYEEEIGKKPPTVEAQMCMALIADVTARLDDLEWPSEEETEE